MTKLKSESPRPIGKQAEQRMRSWVIGMEVHDRLQQSQAVAQLPEEVHPYVAISRETGAGGAEVARQVADKLGWQLVDRDLLNYMADHYKLPKDMLAFVDERTSNWLHEVFGKWLDNRVVTQSEYVRHLGRVVLLAVRHTSSVFVGRGVQFLLPRARGIAIRMIAPLPQRIERTMQVQQLDRDAAKKHVADSDAGRRDFVQRYFHREVEDPSLYDLVINGEFLDYGEAADLIVDHCRRSFSE
jgi:cytidylate kinase